MSEVILLLSAGKGPRECNWLVGRVADALLADAANAGLSTRVVGDDASEGPSCLIALTGDGADAFADAYVGTIRWIGQSPFRPHHKRRNWFAGVSRLPDVADVPSLQESDISYQTMKAGGPGGQHVNTTDSAVRASHGPSGIAVVAREERSQHANRRLARRKLAAALLGQADAAGARQEEAAWAAHQQLERGNAVRTYKGPKFRLVR